LSGVVGRDADGYRADLHGDSEFFAHASAARNILAYGSFSHEHGS